MELVWKEPPEEKQTLGRPNKTIWWLDELMARPKEWAIVFHSRDSTKANYHQHYIAFSKWKALNGLIFEAKRVEENGTYNVYARYMGKAE